MNETIIKVHDETPWGAADFVDEVGPGIYIVSTSSHGGMHLSDEINARIPDYMRRDSGWYEEDCEIAIPCWILGKAAFTNEHTHKYIDSGEAKKTVQQWFPYHWEKYAGLTLEPGQSHRKDEDVYLKAHKDDWLVISASKGPNCFSSIPAGFVVVTATIGGNRCIHANKRSFLVPEHEYEKRNPSLYFHVDPNLYKEVGA
jgi:hypothetical protein